ncbi:hypothetical protein [Azotobacter salinestris]|uniref:hypothetical protein n=1 Tax=Azotobacter salinestris TaxID=69964 RepID=UPI0032DF1A89
MKGKAMQSISSSIAHGLPSLDIGGHQVAIIAMESIAAKLRRRTQKRSGAVHRDLLTEQNTRLASIETMLGEILAELRKPKS